MAFFLFFLIGICIYGALVSIINLSKIKFAQDTLEMVYELHRKNIISSTQAKVFLNDLDNPLDVDSVRGVRWQLEDIIQRERLNA